MPSKSIMSKGTAELSEQSSAGLIEHISSTDAPGEGRWRRVGWLTGLLFLAWFGYRNSFGVPFLFDDLTRIVDAPEIRTLWPGPSFQNSNRPLVTYTFALNYAWGGLNVEGYHLFNFVIHVLASFLLFGIAWRSMLKAWPSMAARAEGVAWLLAAVWVLHPLQTQAVTYVNQRFESLMGLAFLGTLYAFVRGVHATRPRPWLLLALLGCGMGMACKEDMAAAPLLVLWYDRAWVARRWDELLRERKWFYLALSSTWLILLWTMFHYTDEYSGGLMIVVDGLTPWTYLLSQSGVIVHYLRLVFWPEGQSFFYDWPIARSLKEVWPAATLIAILLIATLISMRRFPKLGFLGGCFFLILAPTSSVVPLKDLAFEHRMYLPLAAVLGSVMLMIAEFLRRIRFSFDLAYRGMWMVAVPCLLMLGVATYQRNEAYRSEVSIWKDTIKKSADNVSAWTNLGCAYIRAHQYSEAKEAFEEAVRLAPNSLKANTDLGGLLLEQGEYAAAEVHLTTALQIDANDPIALRNMGNLLLDTGRYQEAIEVCHRGMKVNPHDREVRISLSAALVQTRKYGQAVEECERILEEWPDSAPAHFNLACALDGLGRVDEAIEHAKQATLADRESPNAFGTLAMLIQDRDPNAARQAMARACELAPENLIFHLTMANMLAKESPAEAVRYYDRVLEIDPNHVEAHMRQAYVCEQSGQHRRAIEHLEVVVRLAPNFEKAKDYLRILKGMEDARSGNAKE